MSDPTCRGFRELLGVYVVGAIEPAERSIVDAHLSHCRQCREVLAGLAVLPALLHRIPVADAERLLGPDVTGDDSSPPSPELLPGMLRQVAKRRKAGRLRTALTIAAVSLAVAGGATVATSALAPHSPPPAAQDQVHIHAGLLDAMIKYGKSRWGAGTEMTVRVSGLPIWTKCTFLVVAKDGRRALAGGWIVGPDGGRLWYPADVAIPKDSISEFVLMTNSGKVLKIPAA